jgi:serine/threonine protein kinase
LIRIFDAPIGGAAMTKGQIAGGAVSAAAKERARSLVGRTIRGKYRLEELVAMGGIASVFRAKDLSANHDVAIKVLHPDAEGLPELIERFEREAVAGKHMFHPNVAAVTDIDTLDDGSYFLVQEFIRGITLRDLIHKGPVAAIRAARIARELAVALNAAHDMQIVHRDVKPLNVMILDGHEARVQLIDFGLAKVPVEHLAVANEDARRSLTQAGVVFGTVAYMAPETALGMRALDKRADLYALGVITYEMLAGKHPFTATEPTALFAQQRTAVPPPIGERSPGIVVPTAIERVVHKLLEKDPDTRYPNARAVIAALDAAIREAEDGPKQALAAPGEEARFRIWTLIAVLAVFGLTGLVVWLFKR